MYRKILAKKMKRLAPSPERVQARKQVRQLAKSVDYTNHLPMGRTRSLSSLSKYVTPERIQAGAREAARDMRAYARSEAASGAKMRAKRKITEGYKRASAGFIQRAKNWQ